MGLTGAHLGRAQVPLKFFETLLLVQKGRAVGLHLRLARNERYKSCLLFPEAGCTAVPVKSSQVMSVVYVVLYHESQHRTGQG